MIDEYIDAFFYGYFPNWRRDKDGVFVRLFDDGNWIPVVDWKSGQYEMRPAEIRTMALHFVGIGMRASKYGRLTREDVPVTPKAPAGGKKKWI